MPREIFQKRANHIRIRYFLFLKNIVGTLGYFICPLDVIPDTIPGIGFTDDAGLIVAALGTVAVHIKPEHREAAKAKADEWLA
ncbi:MAG: DUF1232 domain-containing protein [Verrucomicrobia bacterium]|nr:DUF1232 domain-containing protein [Verrucomicrobiota bacterium]